MGTIVVIITYVKFSMHSNSDCFYLLQQVSKALERHVGVVPTKETLCPGDSIVVTIKPLPILELVAPSSMIFGSIMGAMVTMAIIGYEEEACVGLDVNSSI